MPANFFPAFKMFDLEIKCVIRETETDFRKMLSGIMFTLCQNDMEDGQKSIDELKKHLHRGMEDLENKLTMTFIYGWFMEDSGELKCIYCGDRKEDFNYGKRNKEKAFFNPLTTPCPCRLPTTNE